MNYIILLSVLTGCVSSHHRPPQTNPMTYDLSCIDAQIELYNDLCAESSSGFEEMSGSDAHYDGVVCAVESIKDCFQSY